MSYIGLDYDKRDVAFLRRMLLKIIREYKPKYIKLFISPTGRGYHIKFDTKNRLSVKQRLEIRKRLKDDPNRISMVDKKYRDVLFDIKIVDGNIFRSKQMDVRRMIYDGREVLLNG
jgi:hypothetical protein